MDQALLKTLPLVSCAAKAVLITEGQPVPGIYFLETNTLPGLSKASFIPQQLQAARLPLVDFIRDQLLSAEGRYSKLTCAKRLHFWLPWNTCIQMQH